MARGLPFVKMSGAGNDFVLVEAGDLPDGTPRPELARRLCDRRASVGADGLLVLRRGARGRPPELDYYNADGSRAFCANGSRCAAWRASQLGWAGRRFALRTLRGLLDAEVAGFERVRVRMPDASKIRLGLRLRAAGRSWTVHALDTGVPHAVVLARGLDRFPVVQVGRALRRHRAFAPAGANANFIAVRPRGRGSRPGPLVRIRTYERGVEDETLACGTGATASAIVAHLLRGLKPPVRILTRGGDVLTVTFRAGGLPGRPAVGDIWLEGPARVTFQGEAAL